VPVPVIAYDDEDRPQGMAALHDEVGTVAISPLGDACNAEPALR